MVRTTLLALALALPLAAGAQTIPSAPATASGKLQRPPQRLTPEEARELALDVVRVSDVLLQLYDFGDPQQQASLSQMTAALESHLASATDEELVTFAEFQAGSLRDLHAGLMDSASILISERFALEAERARPKSRPAPGEFPELDDELPAYPYIAVVDQIVSFITDPLGRLEEVENWIASDPRQLLQIPLCDGRILSEDEPRARRMPNELLYALMWTNKIGALRTMVAEDICGGAGVDVTVVSLGYSCDICCLFVALTQGILDLGLETTMLCQDMIDSAEIEASWHASKAGYEGIADTHADVEIVQQTADEILDLVSCKPVPELLRQHGCDGFDSDCDGSIDNCSEDRSPPLLRVDEAVSQVWHDDLASAEAAVLRAVHASDDCREVSVAIDELGGACGAAEALVSATDACGNRSSLRVPLLVDEQAPTVELPERLADACYESAQAAEEAIRADMRIQDACTPAERMDVRFESTVIGCELHVRVTAVDLAGRRGSDSISLRIDDREPSVEIDRVALATLHPACFANAAEAEAAVLALTRSSDDCDGASSLSPTVSSSGDPCELSVRVAATDGCGAEASDATTVRVDGNAPSVLASVDTELLWPANHRFVDVGFEHSAVDDCDGEPEIRVTVTSDEPTTTAEGSGGDSGPDAQVLRGPDGRVERIRLRAERASSGNGRVYRITVEATDPCGNVGLASTEVRVPAQRQSVAVDDGQVFEATGVN